MIQFLVREFQFEMQFLSPETNMYNIRAVFIHITHKQRLDSAAKLSY